MADLGDFAGQAAPVARDLNKSGNDVSRLIKALGPFSTASTTALTTLGDALETGRPAVLRTRPLIQDLASFAAEGRPLSEDLDLLTASLDDTGAIERALDFVFFSMTSINGFDEVGHYLRAALGVNLCTPYAARPAPGCTANFTTTRAVGSAASNKPDTSARIAKDPVEGAGSKGSVPPTGEVLGGILGTSEGSQEGRQNAQRIRRSAQRGSPAFKGSDEPMLEYLLGSDR